MPPPRRSAAALAGLVLALAACGLPRDPEGTLAGVRESGRLVVGVAEAPPWVTRPGGGDPRAEPAGVEADLVRGFAASLGAEVEWVWGGLDEHLAALEEFELDLAVGGLAAGSAWSKRVGFTRPYAKFDEVVGVPPGAPAPESLEGLPVAVTRGDPIAAELVRREARVDRVDDPWATGLPVAAPEWEVAARGYRPAGEPLGRSEHVVAVPPGENGLLSRLELYLAGREAAVRERLAAEAGR